LKLEGRHALVVGAGPVAERKIEALLEARAVVTVVSPDATSHVDQLARDGTIAWHRRGFVESDVEGAWLVIAATSDADVQRGVAAAAQARRVFVVAVDDPDHASAYSAAVVRKPPMTVAISSSGGAPALTRLLREIIEQVLPGPDWVEHAHRLRAKWATERTPVAGRFGDLVREFAARAKASE
jgi:uroporphyrin-III C-methyltransferase/precorrin-2 dehydrogenase/sirohydrochlorin ferrochelatase